MPSSPLAIKVVAATATPLIAQSKVEPPAGGCGELVVVGTHGGTRTRYALAPPSGAGGRVVLVLLAGGGGHLALDGKGCPRALTGNFLVRSLALFHGAGVVTARTNGARERVVTVTGGPGGASSGLDACQGRTPHGFLGQEAAVVAGIARFVRGGRY